MKKCIEGPDSAILVVGIVPLLLALLWVVPSRAESNRNLTASGVSREDTLRLGERMYREGVLPSGEPMQAVVKGDIPVAGTAFTCLSCHLRSGLGSYEGGVLTPPTNGATLFRTVKMLYKGVEVTSLPTRRPAYTDTSLAEALRVGVDPSGRILAEIMPRYQLQDEEMALLISYLKSLSARFPPGYRIRRSVWQPSSQTMWTQKIVTPCSFRWRTMSGVRTIRQEDTGLIRDKPAWWNRSRYQRTWPP